MAPGRQGPDCTPASFSELEQTFLGLLEMGSENQYYRSGPAGYKMVAFVHSFIDLIILSPSCY